MTRNRQDLPTDCALYDSGFPCAPFSLLRSNSRLLAEQEAEVFRESIRSIYRTQAPIALLENVVGLLRVWITVTEYMNKLVGYLYCKLLIDPGKLGEPVRRKRVYVLLARKRLDYDYIVILCVLWSFLMFVFQRKFCWGSAHFHVQAQGCAQVLHRRSPDNADSSRGFTKDCNHVLSHPRCLKSSLERVVQVLCFCFAVFCVGQNHLRDELLFPNNHPLVQEDINRLKEGNRREEFYNLDWSSEPEETLPKWLKQHWNMMENLQVREHNLLFFVTRQWRFNQWDCGRFLKVITSAPEVSPTEPKHLPGIQPVIHAQGVQHLWIVPKQICEHQPKHTSHGLWKQWRDDMVLLVVWDRQ